MKKTLLLVLLLCGLAVPAHALDCFVNFGIVTVSAAGSTDTTLTLANGDGASLPATATCANGSAGAFQMVWYDATLYRSGTDDPNREIVRVTTRSGDTLTVTRAQESTTAKAHNVPGHVYKLSNEWTAKAASDLAAGGSNQFAKLGLGTAPSAYILDIADAGGSGAVRAVSNGGGTAVQGLVNSGAGIALFGTSVSTTQPSVVGTSSGYYAGLFYNVTDLGSTSANANNIGLVGQSVYAEAGYFQQGATSGTGSTLARNNIRPGLYVERVSASLGGNNYTLPVFRVKDTTASTGGLMDVIGNSGATTYFQINSNGNLLVKSAAVIGTTNATAIAVPVCTTNCGTSPSVVGSDSAMIVTMGASGSPASGFIITFNGTWSAAPACTGAMAKTGMANTKLPLTIVTSTTTITVVTNGAAPANSDVYAFTCLGVS